ncbi:hypothetical protein CRUP_001308, partial [Coryphaenoides rupestris]
MHRPCCRNSLDLSPLWTGGRDSLLPGRGGADDSDRDEEEDEEDGEEEEEPTASQERTGSAKKKTRTVFSRTQVFRLEATFDLTRYLSGRQRAGHRCLAAAHETQVKIWFQNRRNKWKRQLAAELSEAAGSNSSRRRQCYGEAHLLDHPLPGLVPRGEVPPAPRFARPYAPHAPNLAPHIHTLGRPLFFERWCPDWLRTERVVVVVVVVVVVWLRRREEEEEEADRDGVCHDDLFRRPATRRRPETCVTSGGATDRTACLTGQWREEEEEEDDEEEESAALRHGRICSRSESAHSAASSSSSLSSSSDDGSPEEQRHVKADTKAAAAAVKKKTRTIFSKRQRGVPRQLPAADRDAGEDLVPEPRNKLKRQITTDLEGPGGAAAGDRHSDPAATHAVQLPTFYKDSSLLGGCLVPMHFPMMYPTATCSNTAP